MVKGPTPDDWHASRSETLRYFAFGRVVPLLLYGFLGKLVVGHLITSLRDTSYSDVFEVIAGPVRWAFYAAFCVIPIAIYLFRPLPRARSKAPGARVAALVGTTMLLFVGAVDSGPMLFSPPIWVRDLVAVVLAASAAFEVYALVYLRFNFSIIPEVRRIVVGGPYRMVRHPLYASEIVVAVALVLSQPYQVPALALVPFIALQLTRMDFEEALLASVLPDYPAYAAQTARLIPFVW